MLKSRGSALIGVLISLAEGEGPGAMICFAMEACKGGLHAPTTRAQAEELQVIAKFIVLAVF